MKNFTIHATTINEQPISIDLEILRRLSKLKWKHDSSSKVIPFEL